MIDKRLIAINKIIVTLKYILRYRESDGPCTWLMKFCFSHVTIENDKTVRIIKNE